MALKVGIVGLPNVGKSTLFNALTKARAEAKNFPFTTIEPNVGFASVADPRLAQLSRVFSPDKTTPVAVKIVDIAGLIKGAAEGEGLGNAFLSEIREVDLILEVIRGFQDGNIIHVAGAVNPADDIETINTELILKDLETVRQRINKLPGWKSDFFLNLEKSLDQGIPARDVPADDGNREELSSLNLLSAKPVLYILNISEASKVKAPPANNVLPINIKLEQELSELPEDEARELMRSYGIKESALTKLKNELYKVLGLITFFTAGSSEVRAWSISRGTLAPQAAGQIHTDFEKGFIACDVVPWDRLAKAGSWEKAREKGLVRLEGKDYTMQDGDAVIFKFNL